MWGTGPRSEGNGAHPAIRSRHVAGLALVAGRLSGWTEVASWPLKSEHFPWPAAGERVRDLRCRQEVGAAPGQQPQGTGGLSVCLQLSASVSQSARTRWQARGADLDLEPCHEHCGGSTQPPWGANSHAESVYLLPRGWLNTSWLDCLAGSVHVAANGGPGTPETPDHCQSGLLSPDLAPAFTAAGLGVCRRGPREACGVLGIKQLLGCPGLGVLRNGW